MWNKSFFLVRLNMYEVVSQWLTGSGNKPLGPGDQKSSVMNISCIAGRAKDNSGEETKPPSSGGFDPPPAADIESN